MQASDLRHCVEQQAQPARGHRTPRQVALHLRLVAPEIGEEQEGAAQQAAPDVEAVVPVEVGSDRVQPPGRARQVYGIAERYGSVMLSVVVCALNSEVSHARTR